MGAFLRDLRIAARGMRKAPGYAAITIGVLALGIGATTAIFSVVDGVLLRPLPFPEPDRIVQVRHVSESGASQTAVSFPNYVDLASENHGLEVLSAYQAFAATVTGDGAARRANAAAVTGGFFDVLGVHPALGREFLPEEVGVADASVVVVGHDYWRRRLGAPRDLAGTTVRSGGRTYAVVGVMPPGFDFPSGAELWLPSEASLDNQTRTGHNFQVVARIREGVTLTQARTELSGIARRLKARYGEDTWMSDVEVMPLREQLVGRLRPVLTLLLGAAGLLLLVACANVVNLLLARMIARRREVAVRLALGAGRGRLASHFLAEALVLSAAGGGLGALLAAWGVPALLALDPGGLPRVDDVGVNGGALLFALVASGLAAALLALAGALHRGDGGVRTSLADLGGAGGGGAGSPFGPRRLLAVAQVALSLVLLLGAGLLGRSFLRVLAVDPGYRTAGALVMDLWSAPAEEAAAQRELGLFHEDLVTRLGSLPGVEAVGGVNVFPLSGGGPNGTFVILDDPDALDVLDGARTFEELMRDPDLLARLERMMKDQPTGYAEFRVAGEGYFGAMGIPLVLGRLFDVRDGPDAPHVAVISRSLAESRWPDEDPVGKLIEFGNMDGDLRPFTVVGVVGDVRDRSLESDPIPTFYASARQRPGSTSTYHVVLRGGEDDARTLAAARRIAAELDPDAAVRFRTLEQVFSAALAPRRFSLVLLGVFAATALVLAMMGIYGTISYLASQRAREIGIRIALGATRRAVWGMVFRQGLAMALGGVAVGLLVGRSLGWVLESAVYGVTPLDVPTYAGAAAVLMLVAVAASWVPAARAATVEPTRALRTE